MCAHTHAEAAYQVYNVATNDTITVREIAELAVERVGLSPEAVRFEYTGGNRGWKGDVPVVRLATERIRKLGWAPQYSSREALRRAIDAMLPEMKAGRM
jgi:UDP-glucose 4-epimerase